MNTARALLGVVVAALYLLVLGPPRRWAQKRGLAVGRWTPVALHKWLCWALRVRVTRIGSPSPAPKRLIVANHVSWLDIPILGSIEPMTFLAKKEVGNPFLGRQAVKLQGVVFVDRSRKRCIPGVNAGMTAAMRAGEPVVLFAEATTSDGNRILPFKSSHFEAARVAGPDAVVQPVFLHYRLVGGLPVERRDRPLIAWYGDMSFLPHLWDVLAHQGITCEVHYGAPIAATPATHRKDLARTAERGLRNLHARARSVLPARRETR